MLTNVVGHGPEMSDNQIEMLMNVVEHGVDPEVAWKIINGLPTVATATPPPVAAASWRPTVSPPQPPVTAASWRPTVSQPNQTTNVKKDDEVLTHEQFANLQWDYWQKLKDK